MKPKEPTPAMLDFARQARLIAAAAGPYTGQATLSNAELIRRCRHVFALDARTSALIIFTLDVAMHSSGWWKNPDYERCEHLSVSFLARDNSRTPLPQDHKMARLFCLCFFGAERCRMLWVEPPYSAEGRTRDVYHYRLFMEPDWRTPLLPRKEVYTREFTEAGWKSFSEIHGDEPKERDA